MSFKPPSRYRSMTSTSAGSIGIRRSSANLVRSSPISASTRAPVESASPPKLVMTRSRDGSETPPLPRGGPRRRSTPCRARPAAPVRAYPSRPRPEVVDARICVVQLLSRRQSRRCGGCGQLIASTGRGRSPGGEWRRWPGVGREGGFATDLRSRCQRGPLRTNSRLADSSRHARQSRQSLAGVCSKQDEQPSAPHPRRSVTRPRRSNGDRVGSARRPSAAGPRWQESGHRMGTKRSR